MSKNDETLPALATRWSARDHAIITLRVGHGAIKALESIHDDNENQKRTQYEADLHSYGQPGNCSLNSCLGGSAQDSQWSKQSTATG